MTELTYKFRQMAADKARAKRKAQEQMIFDYGDALAENAESRAVVLDESALPHPKEAILEALLNEIARNSDKQMVQNLSSVVMTLATYQSGVGPNLLTVPTKEQIAEAAADRDALMNLVQQFDSEKYLHFAQIMRDEAAAILQMTKAAKKANIHIQPFYIRAWRHFRFYFPAR